MTFTPDKSKVNRKRRIMVIYPTRNFLKILLLFVSSLSVPKCASSTQETISLEPTTETQDPSNSFLKYYNPIEEDFTIRMPAYSLPLEIDKIPNFPPVSEKYLTK
ncbi:MAG: hypothetical protein P8Y30_06345 [candidate division WOR-3 bacterium]